MAADVVGAPDDSKVADGSKIGTRLGLRLGASLVPTDDREGISLELAAGRVNG